MAIKEAPNARKEEYNALKKQRDRKMKRKAILKGKKLKVQKENMPIDWFLLNSITQKLHGNL